MALGAVACAAPNAEAARSVTISSASRDHPMGMPSSDTILGAGQVSFNALDTVQSIQLRLDGGLMFTGYILTGTALDVNKLGARRGSGTES